MDKYKPLALSVLRIVAGLCFMEHGAQKLFGVLGGHAVPLFSLIGLAGVLDFFGGLAILLGLATRPVAFLLSGEMAVAYFMAHAPQGLFPVVNHGEPAVLYCFIFLFLWTAGGGPLSLDEKLKRIR